MSEKRMSPGEALEFIATHLFQHVSAEDFDDLIAAGIVMPHTASSRALKYEDDDGRLWLFDPNAEDGRGTLACFSRKGADAPRSRLWLMRVTEMKKPAK